MMDTIRPSDIAKALLEMGVDKVAQELGISPIVVQEVANSPFLSCLQGRSVPSTQKHTSSTKRRKGRVRIIQECPGPSWIEQEP